MSHIRSPKHNPRVAYEHNHCGADGASEAGNTELISFTAES